MKSSDPAPATTPSLTYSEALVRALDLYWFGGKPEVALQVIGVLTDWRQERVLLATAGEDGAL